MAQPYAVEMPRRGGERFKNRSSALSPARSVRTRQPSDCTPVPRKHFFCFVGSTDAIDGGVRGSLANPGIPMNIVAKQLHRHDASSHTAQADALEAVAPPESDTDSDECGRNIGNRIRRLAGSIAQDM